MALLIVASDVFALMGLRHLYVLLIRTLDRLVYLDTGLAAVCAFIGGKLILEALHDDGVRWAVHIPTWLSIAVVVASLLLTAIASSAGQTAERRRQRLAVAANGPMSMGLLPGVEHGRSPDPGVARWQDRLTGLQRRPFGGCHLNRPISQMVADCGVELTRMDNYYAVGPKPFGYMFEGRAAKA